MEGTSVNQVKLSLKIMVDTKARKVVFAEAGTEFVDFLFHLLSLPLATVVKLASNGEMTGSLPALYKSVESLSAEYFEQNVNKDTVLMPKLCVNQPLLALNYAPPALTYYYKCPHDYISSIKGETCPRYPASCTMQEALFCVIPQSEKQPSRYVKKAVPYIVMDNLQVKPMSMTLLKSLVSDDHLVEKDVEFGMKEALTLLRASLSTNNVLTTVFLGIKKETM